MSRPTLTTLPVWQALQQRAASLGQKHLRQLFAEDPHRGESFRVEDVGLYLDYSKQRVDADTLRLLRELAGACELPRHVEAMFRGERINRTEDRAVLHVALRAPRGERIEFDGRDVVADVHAVLDRMAAFADRVRAEFVDQPGARGVRVSESLERGEGLGRYDEQGRGRVGGLQHLREMAAVDVRNELAARRAAGIGPQCQHRHRRSQVRAADANVDHQPECCARAACDDASAHVFSEGQHARTLGHDRAFDVRPANAGSRGLAQCHVQHRAILGDVNVLAAPHGVDARPQADGVGQCQQLPQRDLIKSLA